MLPAGTGLIPIVNEQPSGMEEHPSRRSWLPSKSPLGGIRYRENPVKRLILRYRHEPSPQRFPSILEFVCACSQSLLSVSPSQLVDVSALHTRAAFIMSATRSPTAKRSRVGERTLLACLRCKQKKLKVGEQDAGCGNLLHSKAVSLTLPVSATAKARSVKTA